MQAGIGSLARGQPDRHRINRPAAAGQFDGVNLRFAAPWTMLEMAAATMVGADLNRESWA